MATEIFAIDTNNGKDKQLTYTNKNIYDRVSQATVKKTLGKNRRW